MRVVQVETAEEFQQKAGGLLSLREAENHLMLGILSNLLRKAPGDRVEHQLFLLQAAGETVGAVLRTPPFPWVITRLPEEFLPLLAEQLAGKDLNAGGVCGPRVSAFPLARETASRMGKKEVLETAMGIHQLDEVFPVPPAPGLFRSAEPSDVELLTRWCREFNEEIQAGAKVDERSFVQGHLADQRLFVWEDGRPVCMGAFGGNTPNGARVYGIFTPMELRRLGYATNLTARLSQRILDSGRKSCFLFTDMANPTSNHIYRKMGYRLVGDWDLYKFVRGGG